jgi:hypothetical protein
VTAIFCPTPSNLVQSDKQAIGAATRRARLKTGADVRWSKQYRGRAEFFALPRPLTRPQRSYPTANSSPPAFSRYREKEINPAKQARPAIIAVQRSPTAPSAP